MKTVEMYQSEDGQLHSTKAGALLSDELTEKTKRWQEELLKPVPDGDGCMFSNGYGYIQQDADSAKEYKRRLLEEARKHTDLIRAEWVAHPDEVHSCGIAGRFIDECCPAPLYRAWFRVSCIDEQSREWGQPYYALNPDKGGQYEYFSEEGERARSAFREKITSS